MDWEIINENSAMLEIETIIWIYIALFIFAMLGSRQRRNFKK